MEHKVQHDEHFLLAHVQSTGGFGLPTMIRSAAAAVRLLRGDPLRYTCCRASSASLPLPECRAASKMLLCMGAVWASGGTSSLRYCMASCNTGDCSSQDCTKQCSQTASHAVLECFKS